MSDGGVVALGPHAAVAEELVEWWEDVSSGGVPSQLVTVRTDRDWGTDVVARMLVDAVVAGQTPELPDMTGNPVKPFWGDRPEGGLAPRVANPMAMPSCMVFAADCFDDPTLGSDRALADLAAQFEGVATELTIAERPAAHSEVGLCDPGMVAAQLVTIGGVLAAIAGAGPLVTGGIMAADLAGAAWAQARSALEFRRRYGSIGQNIESGVLANARMLGAVSLSVPVLLVLDRTDLANEVIFDLVLGATELDQGRVLVVMFEPDSQAGRSAQITPRIGGLPVSQQQRVHVEAAGQVDPGALASAAREVCGGSDSALVEAIVGQVNTLGALGRLVRSAAIKAQLDSGTLRPEDVFGWVDRKALQTPVGVDQQRCLAVAGLLGPSVPTAVLTHLLGDPANAWTAALSDLGWLVEISPGLLRFPSGAVMATAAATSAEVLTPQEQEATARASLETFRALTGPDTPAGVDVNRAVLWTLAHRLAEGPVDDDLADRLWQVAQDAADQGAFMVAAQLGMLTATNGENATARQVTASRWAEQSTIEELPANEPVETVARGLLRLAARRNAADPQVIKQTSTALGTLSGHVDEALLAGWWLELAERLLERGETDSAADALSRSMELCAKDLDIRLGQERLAADLESGVAGRRRLVARLTDELDNLLSIGDIREVHAVIEARTELAWLHSELGEFRQAQRLGEAALADQARALGPEHPDALRTRSNTANWLGDAGNGPNALKLHKELLPDRQRVLGPDHPDTLKTRNNIATWTMATGDHRAALDLFAELSQDQVRLLGLAHIQTLRSRNNLASLVGSLFGHRAALLMYEGLLPDQERVLGPDHPSTLTTRNNIAYSTHGVGKSRSALELFERLLPDQVRVLGSNHPNTLRVLSNIASLTSELGDHRAAIKLAESLLTDQMQVLGPDHPSTLTTRNNIASLTGELGYSQAAVKLFERLLPDQVRVLGPDHPDTLTMRYNVARWTGEAGETLAAMSMFERLLPDQVRVLGPDHAETTRTRNSITP